MYVALGPTTLNPTLNMMNKLDESVVVGNDIDVLCLFCLLCPTDLMAVNQR